MRRYLYHEHSGAMKRVYLPREMPFGRWENSPKLERRSSDSGPEVVNRSDRDEGLPHLHLHHAESTRKKWGISNSRIRSHSRG